MGIGEESLRARAASGEKLFATSAGNYERSGRGLRRVYSRVVTTFGRGLWYLPLALVCAGCGGREFASEATGGGAGTGAAGGAGGTAGAAQTGGAGGVTDCGLGTVSGVVDDFTDGIVAPQWKTYGSIVSESAGEAVVTFTPNVFEEWGGYRSAAPLLFTDCSVLGALQEIPNPAAQAVATFSVSSSDALTFVEIGVYQGWTRVLVKIGGVTEAEESSSYDENQHAWLRLRDESGTTHFETSADGKSWVELHNVKTPSELGKAYVDFGGSTWGAHDSPGEVRFDNLNRPPE